MSIKNRETKKKLFKNNIYAFLMDLYKVTYSSYTKVSLTKLQEKNDIYSSVNQWLLNKAIKDMGIIKQIGNTGNIKYYWSYAEMPNMKLANRIIEKINLYKINKDKTKDDLNKLKLKGLIPINKKEIDYAKIYKKSVKNMSNDTTTVASDITSNKYEFHVSKLLNHRYYNNILKFVKFYRSNKLDCNLYIAVQNFDLPPVVGIICNKIKLFNNDGYLNSDVTTFHIIALVQLYWRNKLSNIKSYEDIKLIFETFIDNDIESIQLVSEPVVSEPVTNDKPIDNAVNVIISHLDSKFTNLTNKKTELTNQLYLLKDELDLIDNELSLYNSKKDLINSLLNIL